MPPFKRTFTQGSDAPLISFDFTDVAEGTGIVTLQGGVSEASGVDIYQLNKNSFDVGQALTVAADYERSNLFNAAITFSLAPFNTPQMVTGTFYASFSTAYDQVVNTSWQVKVEVMKNSDILGEVFTQEYADTADAVRTHLVAISITDRIKFKKGDIFKVKFSHVKSAVGSVVYLMHDTMNRDFTRLVPNVTASTNPTRLQAYMPLDIQL